MGRTTSVRNRIALFSHTSSPSSQPRRAHQSCLAPSASLHRAPRPRGLAHLKRTIQTSAGHKRKYDELLDRTEREARLRAQAKWVAEKLEREERTKRRDGLKYTKTQELVASRSSLRREQTEFKGLKRSLECQICREEPWDTATTCGHLFSAECIKHWLEEKSAWMEDDEGILIFQAPRCPACRLALSGDMRIYV